jgi:hypothetical protein
VLLGAGWPFCGEELPQCCVTGAVPVSCVLFGKLAEGWGLGRVEGTVSYVLHMRRLWSDEVGNN